MIANTPPTEQGKLGRRILLVEYGEIHQKLALSILRRTGYSVEVVETGAQAFEKARSSLYDAMVMGVLLPEMNGMDAASQIREWEKGKERHIPIIALGNTSEPKERELCLRSGMDEYVPKPLDSAALMSALEKTLGKKLEPPVNINAALTGFGGDRAFMIEMFGDFKKQLPNHAKNIHDALQSGDAKQLMQAAHNLKGVALTFCANATATVALQLEEAGRREDLTNAPSLVARLDEELRRLENFLSNQFPQ